MALGLLALVLLPPVRDRHKRQSRLPHNPTVGCTPASIATLSYCIRRLRLGDAVVHKVARPGLGQSVRNQISRSASRGFRVQMLVNVSGRLQFPWQRVQFVEELHLRVLRWPHDLVRVPTLLLKQVLLDPALHFLLVR